MSNTKTIGIITGSLRKNSFSQSIADFINTNEPAGYKFKQIEIGDLPFYNPDLDEGTAPSQWTRFREELKAVDAVLFITPEYNRTIPAVLKNAIDVGSRPYGDSAWEGKAGAIISQSPGAISGFGANHHLRQALTFLNIYTLQQPEAYIGNIHTLLDENGNLSNEDTKGFLNQFISAFTAFIEKVS